jgi:hypothetical protein
MKTSPENQAPFVTFVLFGEDWGVAGGLGGLWVVTGGCGWPWTPLIIDRARQAVSL